jgi:hypothetical protein
VATREYCHRQIIKPFPTLFAGVSAACLLPMVLAAFINLIGRAVGAIHTMRPTTLSDGIVTFVFVYKVVDI